MSSYQALNLVSLKFQAFLFRLALLLLHLFVLSICQAIHFISALNGQIPLLLSVWSSYHDFFVCIQLILLSLKFIFALYYLNYASFLPFRIQLITYIQEH